MLRILPFNMVSFGAKRDKSKVERQALPLEYPVADTFEKSLPDNIFKKTIDVLTGKTSGPKLATLKELSANKGEYVEDVLQRVLIEMKPDDPFKTKVIRELARRDIPHSVGQEEFYRRREKISDIIIDEATGDNANPELTRIIALQEALKYRHRRLITAIKDFASDPLVNCEKNYPALFDNIHDVINKRGWRYLKNDGIF